MIPFVVWGGAHWHPTILYTRGGRIHRKDWWQDITTYFKYRRENVLIILIINVPQTSLLSNHWLVFYKCKNDIGLLYSHQSTWPRIISIGISNHGATNKVTKVWAVQCDTQTINTRELEYNHIMACAGVMSNSVELKLIASTFAATAGCGFCISSCNLCLIIKSTVAAIVESH